MNRIVLIACGIVGLLVIGCGPEPRPVDVPEPEPLGAEALLQQQIEGNYTNPDLHFQLGRLYQAQGHYSRAEWEYGVALQFAPVFYPAQAARVRALMQMGEAQRAQAAATEYLGRATNSAEASSRLGRAFEQQQLEQYALVAYQQALAAAPESADAYRQLGYYFLARGDMVRAEEYLRRSIEIDPYQPQVAEQLGRMGVVIQTQRTVPPTEQPEEQAAE